MEILPISVPTPFYVGAVNVYLIKTDPLTLIDVGPKTGEAREALRAGLAEHGVSFADVRRIVLTHAHEDHCGLAKEVRDAAKNAEVYVHKWESGHLFGRISRSEQQDLLARAGVPADVIEGLRGVYANVGKLTDRLEEHEYLHIADGDELRFDGGSLTVLHTPGHTAGSCSFLREANRTLISGDCVLKRITPNPMLMPDPYDPQKRFRSLGEYLVSLAKLRSFAPTLTYCGHGEPVTDFEEIFNTYVRAINERQAKVIGLLEPGGSTAWEIAVKLFPDAVTQDMHRFLAISEASAHLDLAEAEGRIAIELKDGVEHYRRH